MKNLYLFLIGLFVSTQVFAMAVDIEEPRTITADKIEYDLKSETIKTTGDTEIVNASGQRMTLVDSYITQKGTELSGDERKKRY